MDEPTHNAGNTLDYHYRETVRLANICDSYVKEAFADFKLLAAIGGILAWKPVHDALKLGGSSDASLLFFGFVVILLLLAVVGIMNLQKQLIIRFHLEQLQHFETEIRSLLGHPDAPTFRVAENWRASASVKQLLVGLVFYLLFYVAALTPALVLDFCREPYYGAKYLRCALGVIAAHIVAIVIVHGKFRRR